MLVLDLQGEWHHLDSTETILVLWTVGRVRDQCNYRAVTLGTPTFFTAECSELNIKLMIEKPFTHYPSPFPQPPPHTHHSVSTAFPGSTHEPLTPVLPTGAVVVALVAVACLGFRCIPSIWKPFRSPTVRQLLSIVETVQIWQTSVWILAPAYTSHMIFSKLTYLCIPQFLPLYAEVIINKS